MININAVELLSLISDTKRGSPEKAMKKGKVSGNTSFKAVLFSKQMILRLLQLTPDKFEQAVKKMDIKKFKEALAGIPMIQLIKSSNLKAELAGNILTNLESLGRLNGPEFKEIKRLLSRFSVNKNSRKSLYTPDCPVKIQKQGQTEKQNTDQSNIGIKGTDSSLDTSIKQGIKPNKTADQKVNIKLNEESVMVERADKRLSNKKESITKENRVDRKIQRSEIQISKGKEDNTNTAKIVKQETQHTFQKEEDQVLKSTTTVVRVTEEKTEKASMKLTTLVNKHNNKKIDLVGIKEKSPDNDSRRLQFIKSENIKDTQGEIVKPADLASNQESIKAEDQKDYKIQRLTIIEHDFEPDLQPGRENTSIRQNYSNRNRVNPENIFKQINEQVKLANRPGKKEMEIKLEPDFLGKIKIKLEVEGGKLNARFLVENNFVKHHLENNLNTLKVNLVKQGFNTDQINVETDNNSSGFHNKQQFDQNDSGYQQRHQNSRDNGYNKGNFPGFADEIDIETGTGLNLTAGEIKQLNPVEHWRIYNSYYYRQMNILA